MRYARMPTHSRTRRDLTGLSKREALVLARKLLPRAKAGDLSDAAMLVDVAIYARQTNAAERLELALRGRTYPAGDVLSPDAAARNLKDALETVTRSLFPPRARPCMPGRRQFMNLVTDSVDVGERLGRDLARALWKELEAACATPWGRAIERAMDRANDTLRGSGVESVRLETRRGPDLVFDYVNFGDTYDTTLVYDHHANRFRITSWGDMVEAWERRWGRVDEWTMDE